MTFLPICLVLNYLSKNMHIGKPVLEDTGDVLQGRGQICF